MPRSTTDRRRTDTRDRLVRAAMGLFRRQGVGAVGVQAVCTRAGVTKGVFCHHFPGGKDELVRAVVAANRGIVLDGLATTAGPERAAPDVVRSLFAGYARAMRAGGTDFGCPVAASVVDAGGSSAATRRAAADAFTAWRDRLGARLGPETAELAIAAIEGSILLARAAEDPQVLERVGGALAGLLVPESER